MAQWLSVLFSKEILCRKHVDPFCDVQHCMLPDEISTCAT